MITSARFSPCRTWRYTLERVWGSGEAAVFIGLNPSTADETEDDPTIRRCIGFAQSWGYDRLIMCNLYAYRSTDPKGLLATPDPVGPENDVALQVSAEGAGVVVAAWGVHGKPDRVGHVRGLLPDLLCLGHTKAGAPKHPLYLPKDTPLEVLV